MAESEAASFGTTFAKGGRRKRRAESRDGEKRRDAGRQAEGRQNHASAGETVLLPIGLVSAINISTAPSSAPVFTMVLSVQVQQVTLAKEASEEKSKRRIETVLQIAFFKIRKIILKFMREDCFVKCSL